MIQPVLDNNSYVPPTYSLQSAPPFSKHNQDSTYINLLTDLVEDISKEIILTSKPKLKQNEDENEVPADGDTILPDDNSTTTGPSW